MGHYLKVLAGCGLAGAAMFKIATDDKDVSLRSCWKYVVVLCCAGLFFLNVRRRHCSRHLVWCTLRLLCKYILWLAGFKIKIGRLLAGKGYGTARHHLVWLLQEAADYVW
jgi:hypothetical protein